MSFRQNLIHARSHIIFLAALGCGLALVTSIDGKTTVAPQIAETETKKPMNKLSAFDDVEPLPLMAPAPVSEQDLSFAKTAWTYFENNTNPNTGLVNSADKYPSTTMWETGSYFVATISADLLGIIEEEDAKSRIGKVLQTLSSQRLYGDILPNKAYNVQTGELVDYSNKPSKEGLGWSALDIARLVSTLGIVENHYPEFSPEIKKLFAHWDLTRMVREGDLLGGNIADGKLREDQEGRIGYQQYAAKAMMLFGYDMYQAYDVTDTLMVRYVEGVPVPVDNRMHRNVTPAFTVSEPYVFDGIEYGFDSRSHLLATAIYKAQEARYQNSGVFTAVSESHLDEAPYFIYSTVWGGGAPWAVLSFRGERLDSKRTISTKTAFAWNALFGTDYSKELIAEISSLNNPERGWPEGIYEIDGSINSSVTTNTNAVVLGSIAFKAYGPLIHAAQ